MRAIKERLPKSPDGHTDRARKLRRDSTKAERLLWSKLRSDRIGAKFRRHEPVSSYIVDFACIENGLVIEVDGSQHYSDEGKKQDKERDEYLKSLGFEVMRFSNRDVLINMNGVLTVIQEKLKQPPYDPPGDRGDG